MAARKPKQHPEAKKIVDLRRAGVSFARIGQEIKPAVADPAEVERLWELAVAGTRAKYRTDLELDRLDRMLQGVWTAAAAGDTDAIDRVLKIMAMRERLAPAPRDNDGALTQAYDESVSTSTVVTGVDQALVAAGRVIAARIDEALASGDGQEVTKALYLVPHMMNALRELLATPAARLQQGIAQGKGKAGAKQGGGLTAIRGGIGGKAS